MCTHKTTNQTLRPPRGERRQARDGVGGLHHGRLGAIYIYIYIYICIYVCMYTFTYIYIYIYIHIL